MKKIFLTILIAICSIPTMDAQCTLPYRSLSEFSTDTTAFIKYNFIERGKCYQDKTLEYMLTDLQITPVMSGMGFTLGETDDITFSSLRLYLNRDGANSIYLQIRWKEPIILNSYTKKLFKKYGVNNWVPRYRQTFADYTIQAITTSFAKTDN